MPNMFGKQSKVQTDEAAITAMVSMHKTVRLLLNIVTFSHDEPQCSVANQSQGKM